MKLTNFINTINKMNLKIILICILLVLFIYLIVRPKWEHYGAPDVAKPSFKEHIRVLFREKDVLSMKWKFNLWKYEDVKIYAEPIYRVLKSRRMPCDTPWPKQNIALFRKWIDTGMSE